MDFQRAQEIINSPTIVQVMYKDQTVWLESLDPNSNTAEVSAKKEQSNEKLTVAIDDLEEVHGKH